MTTGRFKLLPKALLSVPVFGISLIWVILVQIGEWAAIGESVTDLGLRLSLISAVQILMFAFPYFTWRVLCPRVHERNWTWVLMVSVIAGAVIRGIAFGILLTLVGVADSPDLVFRVAASITHLAVIVVILWFLVSVVRELHSRRHRLVLERDQLLGLQQSAVRDWEKLSDRATGEIRRSILESLGGLKATDSKDLRERLRLTIDDVVRPLSHQLAAKPSTWAPPLISRETFGVDWPLAIRDGLDPVRIHPVIMPILLAWLGLPIHLFRFGATATAGFVATLIVGIPAFWVARKIAIRLSADHSFRTKAVAFVLAIIFGGFVQGVATLTYMQNETQPFLFLVATPLLALVISGPLAIAETARNQGLELESDLMATTADLRWTITRTRERYRQQESALAHALHGRLQGSLAAAFLRLERAVALQTDNDALLASLQEEVRDAISELDVIHSEPETIDKLIALTQSNWLGTVHIKFSIEQEARVYLLADSLCARSVNDLVPELVFNSVRHGRAGEIDVVIELADRRTLSLTVTDDGQANITAHHYGLGSTLLDQASMTWTRTRTDSHTTTRCLLPCQSPSSQ